MNDTGIQGHCAPGFEPVRDAFAANLAERDEIGASVAVVVRGELAVSLWAGWADVARTRPWQENTLTNMWSVTKAMTSLAAHILIDRDELDPDAPVARYWPEFAAAGKAGIPVRWVMCHQAGLAGLTTPVTVADTLDWEKMTALLAAQEPLWPPGTASGYHAMTFGFLVGELIRRISGQRLGSFFATEVAGPLEADFHMGGVPDSEFARCSELRGIRRTAGEQAESERMLREGHPAARAALANPPVTGDEANDPAWRRAELPAANGHGTAAAAATIFGTLVDGSQRLISARTLSRACASNGVHTDLVQGIPLEYGLGYGLSGPLGLYGPSRAAFGHDGIGGFTLCTDPGPGLAWAYVMNRMGEYLQGDPRKRALMDGIYQSLG